MKWEDLDSLVMEDPPEKDKNKLRNTILIWLFAIVCHGTILYFGFFKLDLIREFIYGEKEYIVEHVEPERKTPQLTPRIETNKPQIQSPPRPTAHPVAQAHPIFSKEQFPGTMLVVFKGNQGTCPLTFDARDIQLDTVVTVFNHQTGERAGWGFLEGGLTVIIRLFPGEYDLETVSGQEWLGRDEMFGNKGITRKTTRPFLLKASQGQCPERIIRMREFIVQGN
jgi:hypothetical protein